MNISELKNFFFLGNSFPKILFWSMLPPVALLATGEAQFTPGIAFGISFLAAHFFRLKHLILAALFLLVSLMAYQMSVIIIQDEVLGNILQQHYLHFGISGFVGALLLTGATMTTFPVRKIPLFGFATISSGFFMGILFYFIFSQSPVPFYPEPIFVFLAFTSWQVPVFVLLSYLIDPSIPITNAKTKDVRNKSGNSKKRKR